MSGSEPLLQLLNELGARDYEFTAVTPATHARVLARPVRREPTLRDIFGWNHAFASADVDPIFPALLQAGNVLEEHNGKLRSKVRVASLGGSLFLHSSFPTDEQDSVFFGPDTYRFTRFVREQLSRLAPPKWVIDMGAGAGAGGIDVARLLPGSRATLVDINPAALRFAEINAAYAGVTIEPLRSSAMPNAADLIIANPPYMMDAGRRSYRDGGGFLGGSVALDWVEQALSSLASGGTMLLYVGAAFEDGRSPLLEALAALCEARRASFLWQEIDPDVFGEELEQPAYARVERIAAMGVLITAPTS